MKMQIIIRFHSMAGITSGNSIFADPYGHTLILVSRTPQTNRNPGQLLAVDAQPDKTIAIKRFWKGNFLFNTNEVVGEPGFKAFRPIAFKNGRMGLMRNEAMKAASGFALFRFNRKRWKVIRSTMPWRS
jgi:hypothetical protein